MGMGLTHGIPGKGFMGMGMVFKIQTCGNTIHTLQQEYMGKYHGKMASGSQKTIMGMPIYI